MKREREREANTHTETEREKREERKKCSAKKRWARETREARQGGGERGDDIATNRPDQQGKDKLEISSGCYTIDLGGCVVPCVRLCLESRESAVRAIFATDIKRKTENRPGVREERRAIEREKDTSGLSRSHVLTTSRARSLPAFSLFLSFALGSYSALATSPSLTLIDLLLCTSLLCSLCWMGREDTVTM